MGQKMDVRQYIKIRGANENNLKGIDVDIPRNELVVLTGLSGSGKSSLAFDTIYAEGQRRYMESLSSYARPVSYTHLDVYKRQNKINPRYTQRDRNARESMYALINSEKNKIENVFSKLL